jgi:hypothetical protein
MRVWSCFLDSKCHSIGIVIGEASSTEDIRERRPYTYLGMVFDHVQRRVSQTPKTVRKLRHMHDVFFDGTQRKILDIMCVFSTCLWASTVVDWRLAKVYNIFKQLRRLARAQHKGATTAAVWTSIVPLEAARPGSRPSRCQMAFGRVARSRADWQDSFLRLARFGQFWNSPGPCGDLGCP